MSTSATLTQLLTLQTWMSAAFPIGAFSCSHGLETAIQDNRVHDSSSCIEWIETICTHGSGWNDSLILAHAHRLSQTLLEGVSNNVNELRDLNDLALALQSGAERYLETTQLASAFLQAAKAWGETDKVPWQALGSELSLPVTLGALGALHNLPLTLLIASSLQSTTSNLVWIAARLIPLGQNTCLQLVSSLEPVIEQVASKVAGSSLDDLGSSALLADLASLQHEQLRGRICQT